MSKKWYNFFVVTDGPAGAPSPAPADPAPNPSRRAADLASALPEVVAPEGAVSGAGTIAAVYEAARIVVPAHGYTVLKVADMLQSAHLGALPPDVKRKSILVALEAAGVSVDDVVRDAIARDRALDTYEQVLEQHVERIRTAKAAENEQIEADMARLLTELRARIDENNRQVSREQEELQAWRVRKQREEATIADTVAHFVTDNPVSTPAAPETRGETDVR